MIKFQQTYTTPEQSQRLLDLGIPVKSADCYYMIISGKIDNQIEVICNLDAFIDSCEYLRDYFPCWSAGRLIEISIMCGRGEKVPNEMYINSFSLQPSLIENIISRLERVACLDYNDFDFSKLDD